jgi:hypothetical protein
LKYAIGEAYGFRSAPVKTAHECRMKLLNRQLELQVTTKRSGSRGSDASEASGSPPLMSWRKPVPLRVVNDASNTSKLARSGAVRGGRPLRLQGRSATFNAPPVDGRPGFVARAETWATADEHRQAYEAA